MSLFAALASAEVWLGAAGLAVGGLLELALEFRLRRVVAGHAVLYFTWEYIGAPLLRAALITGFVLWTYPVLYGLRSAPPLSALLAGGAVAPSTLVNVAFVASLLLPLVPGWRRRGGLVLMVQGLLATALVFKGYAHWLGATSVGAWPGLGEAIAVLVLGWLDYLVGEHAGRLFGAWLDERCHSDGLDALAPHVTALLAQVPTLIAYGYLLGRQLAV
ncbi:MAG: hypothetical protein H6977_15610 [Gammaproteobacteria bacterium]|nr:hypothetical protein [Gammaproteobacteria bacterium]MCP5201429.1 hypothetical protein [Gammaproteobacteria bacterium]